MNIESGVLGDLYESVVRQVAEEMDDASSLSIFSPTSSLAFRDPLLTSLVSESNKAECDPW